MSFEEVSKPVNEEVNSGTARAHNAASGRAADIEFANTDKGPDTVPSEAALKEQAEAKAKAEQAAQDAETSRVEAEAVKQEEERLVAEVAEAEAAYNVLHRLLMPEYTRRKVLKELIADPANTPADITKFTEEFRNLPNDEDMAKRMQPLVLAKQTWDAKKNALKTARIQAKFVADAKDMEAA